MPAPTVCEITFPTDGWTAGAAPSGTATIGCDCETDPSTPVQFFLDDVAYGDVVVSDSEGLAELDIDFPIGTTQLKAIAGVDPDTTTSAEVNVIVQDVIDGITTPESRTVRWYLNYLAGNTVTTIPEGFLPSIRQAACQWAGISPANFGTVAALSIKAGITDPTLYVSQNAALNYIAYGSTNRDDCIPWLTDQQALFKICQEA